jgi:hypothetical protein
VEDEAPRRRDSGAGAGGGPRWLWSAVRCSGGSDRSMGNRRGRSGGGSRTNVT